MGEKEIAPGGDGPKPDPRAGGGPQGGQAQPGSGQPGQGQGGQPGGQPGPGKGGEGGSPEPGGGFVDPMPDRPQPQKIITGPKKTDQPPSVQFPGPRGGKKRDG